MEIVIVLAMVAVGAYFYLGRGRQRSGRGSVAASGTARGGDSWSRSFAQYYLASELHYRGRKDLPDTIVELLADDVSGATEQSVLTSLRAYLSFQCHRDVRPEDYGQAVDACRALGRRELQLANTPTAVRVWLQRSHRAETQTDMTETELRTAFDEIARSGNADKAAALRIQTMVFKSQIDRLFESAHGKPVEEYTEEVLQALSATLSG